MRVLVVEDEKRIGSVYHNLGIDPHSFVRDMNERPVLILPEDARPVAELVG